MTNQQAAQLVAICTAMWPNHPVRDPAALVKGWQLGLTGVAYADAERALQDYLAEGTFFPSPAEIRKLANASEPSLDAKLYRQYADLRRQLQAGELGKRQSSDLRRIERKLGLPTGGDHPVPLREIAS